MSNYLTDMGRIASFRNSVRSIRILKEYKCLLEKMPNKTDLETNALQGLKRSLTSTWIVAIITVIGICLGTWFFCMGMAGDLTEPEYNLETSIVQDGCIKYGRYDTLYDVSDLGYEEGTWLNIYIDKDNGEVAMVNDMFKVRQEEAREQGRLLAKGIIILGITFLFLIIGLIISRGILMKPFRKWHKIYTQTHPSLFESM